MITSKLNNERGSALIVAISVLLMASLVAIQMYSVSSDDMEISFNNQDATRALYAAESGVAIARTELWTKYLEWTSTSPPKKAGKVGSRKTYTTFLDRISLPDSGSLQLAHNIELSAQDRIDSVTVDRDDIGNAVYLTVNSYGASSEHGSQTITTVLKIEGEAFKGFEFAILAKNINCIMCHATIDNVERVFNTDPTKLGTFDRVKVASLESMLLRTDKAESKIAGSLYTRGIVTDKAGNPITDLSPGGMGLNGYDFSSVDGKISEPLATVALTNATGYPLPEYGNLYMDYPINPADQTSGDLPSTFPPPFADDNGNKLVDDAEYARVALEATGSISGGVIYGVPKGSSFIGSSLPGSGNLASITGEYSGNLILIGTDAKPIIINSDIAVDGDVIIQGKIEGTGQILARGNVYVTSDLTYNDGAKAGDRTFGVSQSNKQNAISIAAGKNIIVGDYLTPKGGDILDNTSIDPGNLSGGENFSFAMSEITLFNRGEWQKTQPLLNDASGTPQANPTYDASYEPRYYTMNPGDPVYIFNKQDVYFDAASKTWKGKEHTNKYDMNVLTKIDFGDPALSSASIVSLSSTDNWISATQLKDFWIADETARASGDEFNVDGLLYTNNSIFAMARTSSNTLGDLTINGSLVASDIGVLAGNSLNLNYDARLKSFMKINDDTEVGIQQIAWYAQ